ncbi:sulfotransferase 1 family member D1-like [Anticarsia gemmatalis]|uniref:sulfotransferase 1 family member D1-like n=1 Tax=Anticarsia gemmatalis TaxID=129554 RepID=UPI003F758097
MASLKFPYEIKTVTEEEDKVIKKYYKDYVKPFIRVGPSGHISMAGYGDDAAAIYNLEVRPDDVWVTSYSRSGTTWIQELVWLVSNNLDFETARSVSIVKRFAYIEYPTQKPEIREDGHGATFEDFRTLPNVTSPRYVKSHLPLSLLPPKLLDTAKVFYIARDPRDVAVSHFFAHKLFRYFDDNVQFKEFWDLFRKDLILHTPIFPHVKEAWDKRENPNLMFLFYEEMQNDLRAVIDRVCKFLNKEYTDEQKQQLAEYLNFNNMKKKPMIETKQEDKEITFFRKGKSGNWVQYFDEEMTKQAEEFMEKNLKETDMRFPEVGSK